MVQLGIYRAVFDKFGTAYRCDEEADVRFGELVSDEVVLAFEYFL